MAFCGLYVGTLTSPLTAVDGSILSQDGVNDKHNY